jgi:hypothetical protein
MDKDYKFFWKDGISIESSPPALVLDYSDPDQGGTQLQFKFRINYSESTESKFKTTLEVGYAHEKEHSVEEITLNQFPQIVIEDALTWLREQFVISEESENKTLKGIISQFINLIENGMKNYA